jgi:hypothetical protein
MPTLYDLLTEAQDGEALASLGRQFGLSTQQTEAAVTALLPAISTGLKQSTATPEGLPGGQGGPAQIPMPGGQGETMPSGPQAPGGDILGQILRDLLGGGGGPVRAPQPSGQPRELKDLSDLTKQLGAMDSVGEKVFGDRFEVGRDIEQDHVDNIQRVFDRFYGAR